MTSRTSCFNRALCGQLLRRFWPVWLVYFLLLLLSFCFQIPQLLLEQQSGHPINMQVQLLMMGMEHAGVAPFAAIVTVMALFSYLYNSRVCGLMHALPLRRETLFVTTWLTGLVPLMLTQVLAALLGWLFGLGGGVRFLWVLQWLGLSAMAFLAFYGFAVFCAFLTGSLWVLPAVYAVLGFAVVVAENCAKGVLGRLSYGSFPGEPRLAAFSPILYALDRLTVAQDRAGGFALRGLGVLAVYAVLGLVLSGCALLLYKRRQLECTGDAVAVPVLKPVFRLCMGFGCAFVFTALMQELLLLPASPAALTALTLLLLLAGAFVGVVLAEMLLQRTLKPVLRAWKGPAALALLLVLLTAGVRLDLSGAQRWCPEPEDVSSVTVSGVTLRSPESIREATALHRSLLAHRARLEGTREGFSFPLVYTLADGQTRSRRYLLPYDEQHPDEDLLLLEALLNCPEAVEERVRLDVPVTAETLVHAQLEQQTDEDNYAAFTLTPEQAAALYREGILPDAAEGHMGQYRLFEKEPGGLYFHMVLFDEHGIADGTADGRQVYESFVISPEAAHSRAWIAENLGLDA